MKQRILRIVFCVPIILFMLFLNVGTASAEECFVIDRNNCVPGLISTDTWYTPQPEHTIGKAVWYAPYVMEATAKWRDMSLEGFKGGVSLFSPADIGEVVWIKRVTFEWEGPFLVVDASQRNHMYTTVTFVKEVIEVDFDTALSWGMVEWTAKDKNEYIVHEWMLREVEVYKGLTPPENSIPVRYDEFFLETVVFDDTNHPHWVFDETKIANYAEYNEVLALQESKKVALAVNSTDNNDLRSKGNQLAQIPQKVAVFGDFSPRSRMLSMSPSKRPTRNISFDVVVEEVLSEDPTVLTYAEAHRYKDLEGVQVVDQVSWRVNCNDNNPFTGFWTLNECAPGVVTRDTWMMKIPKHTIGVATYYMPGIVDKVLKNRGMTLDGYIDAIVVMSCGHIGESAWVKRPGFGWQGPYLIIDCSQPYHSWVNISNRHLHVEVKQSLWEEWRDTTGTQNIELCLGSSDCTGNPISFWYYWDQRAKFLVPSDVANLSNLSN